ncbi:MAG: hypothetical protein ACK51T_13215 [bacterium]
MKHPPAVATHTLAAAMILFAGLPSHTHAQIPPPPAPTTNTTTILNPFAARSLTRAVLVDLKSLASPGPADYQLAAALLQSAGELADSPADIYRLALAAAQEGGDTARVLELSRLLVKADPTDTVAQLQLIEARANASETAAGKLEVYSTVLGPRGVGVDPAVRSRVALQSALVKKQTGDSRGYAQDLTTATALDSSNKQAAALALEFFAERVDEPSANLELVTNLLLADPLDAQTHLMLADIFARSGAPLAALRFYALAEAILTRSGQALEPPQQAQRWVQIGNAQGPRQAMLQLTELIAAPRREAQLARKQAEQAKRPLTDLPDPATIRLRPELERLRFAYALGLSDAPTIAESLADYAAYAADFTKDLPPGTPPAPPEFELAFMRLLANVDAEKAAQDVARFVQASVPAEVLARLQALTKHRAGDTPSAQAELQGIPDDTLAMLALAQIKIESKDNPQAIDTILTDISTRAPGTPAAAWAQTTYAQRTGKPIPAPATAERFASIAAGIPNWVDEVVKEPARFLTVLATAPREPLQSTDPTQITLQIRHHVPVPLALGPGEVLDSRFLIIATPDFGRGIDPARTGSEVINLDRRLRLMPREELRATIWPDPGAVGWSIQSAPAASIRVRYRIINGFQVIDNVPRVAGFGAATEVGPLRRLVPQFSNTAALTEAIKSDQGQTFATAVQGARRALLTAGTPEGIPSAQAQALATPLAERYTRESPAGRILLLAEVPTLAQSPAVAPFDAAVRATVGSDTTTSLLALLTRAGTADDPLFTAAKASTVPTLSRCAQAIQSRITAGRGGLATLKATTPPTPPQ